MFSLTLLAHVRKKAALCWLIAQDVYQTDRTETTDSCRWVPGRRVPPAVCSGTGATEGGPARGGLRAWCSRSTPRPQDGCAKSVRGGFLIELQALPGASTEPLQNVATTGLWATGLGFEPETCVQGHFVVRSGFPGWHLQKPGQPNKGAMLLSSSQGAFLSPG